MSKEAWVHLHLPRLRSGDPDPISIKIPGQKIEYGNVAILDSARFVVNPAGRKRALEQNVRNVHAWVVGQPLATGSYPSETVDGILEGVPGDYRRAVYDPWKGEYFVDADTLEPLTGASYNIIMVNKVVYYR